MAVYLSDRLIQGTIYTRAELAKMLETRDATINTGIFQPRGYDSILLFVTETKSSDMTQYRDHLNGDTLHWQGQQAGIKDVLIFSHERKGLELLVFYRRSKRENSGGGFTYEGLFRYQSHAAGRPSNFVLERINIT